MTHEHLPVKTALHRIDKTNTTQCPTCKTTKENHYHFFQCNHPTPTTQWENLTKELGALGTKMKTDPNLQNLLINGLTKYWQNEQTPTPPRDPQLKQLFYHQRKIGWKQLMYGRFSTKWAAAFETLYTKNHHQPSPSGKTWVTQVIRTTWRHLLEMWKARCEDEHGKTTEEKYSAKRTILLIKVRSIYESANQIPNRTRHQIMQQQEQDICQKKNQQIEQWVALVLPIVQMELRARKTQANQNTQDIRTFFNPKPPKPPKLRRHPLIAIREPVTRKTNQPNQTT
jgi:hypothetical protein